MGYADTILGAVTNAGARPATTGDPWQEANAVDMKALLQWRGIELDGDNLLKCPSCGADGRDSSVSIVDGGWKCQHASCASKGHPRHPGFRTAVDAVAELAGIEPAAAVNAIAARFGTTPLPEKPRVQVKDGKFVPTPEAEDGAPLARVALADVWAPLDRVVLYDQPPRRDWILVRAADHSGPDVGFMPRGKALMLAAAGGVGKTTSLGQLALTVASGTGRPWIGPLVAADDARGGRVLLVLGEEDRDEVHRRLYAGALALKLTPEQRDRALANIVALPMAGRDCRLTTASRHGDPERTELHAELVERMATDGPWTLAILDPLARFAGAGAEVTQEAATAFTAAIEALTEAPGRPAALVAHHTSQASRQTNDRSALAARGVTALTDGFRWVAALSVEPESDGRIVGLSLAKSNYTQPFGETFYARRDFDLGGALVPVEADALEELEEARRAAEPTTRRAEARAERVRTAAEKERDLVLSIVAAAPAHMTTGQVDLALRARGVSKSKDSLRSLLQALRDDGLIADLSGGSRAVERRWVRAESV
jgi:DNA-binding transcriptional ArsR family regulator